MFLHLILYLNFVFFSLGQVGRISFYGQQINIYLYEVFVLLVLLVLLGRHGLRPIIESFKRVREVYIFFLFLLFSYLLGIKNYKPLENFIGFLYFLRLFIYFIYFFCLSYQIKKNSKFKNILSNSFLIFIFLTTIISLVQYFFYPDLRNLIYSGWDPHLYRMFGTFFDTSVAGAVYGLIFIALFLNGKDFIKNKIILISSLVTYFLFIALTYSRALYGAIIIVFIIYSIVKRYYRQFFIFLAIFTVLIFVIPKPFGEGVNLLRTISLEARVQDYTNALRIWQKYPLFGVGYNRIRYEKVKLNILKTPDADITHSGASFHSSFLVILVTSGVIGLVLFLLVLIKLSQFSEFAQYAVVFLSILSMADNILLHPFVLYLLLNLAGLSKFIPFRKRQ